MKYVVRLSPAAVTGVLLAVIFHCAAAQEPSYSMGLVLEDPETYATFPKAPKYRAVLPERVDLSSRFPKPGNQRQQGSCTAWAVAYGARSYYDGLVDGQAVSPQSAFSPAYISTVEDHCSACLGFRHSARFAAIQSAAYCLNVTFAGAIARCCSSSVGCGFQFGVGRSPAFSCARAAVARIRASFKLTFG